MIVLVGSALKNAFSAAALVRALMVRMSRSPRAKRGGSAYYDVSPLMSDPIALINTFLATPSSIAAWSTRSAPRCCISTIFAGEAASSPTIETTA